MPFENRTVNRVIMAYILDIAGTIGALIIAGHLRLNLGLGRPIGPDILNAGVFALVLPIWTMIFYLLSIYDPRRTYRFVDEIQNLLAAICVSLLVLAGALYFSYREISRLLIIYFFVQDIAILVLWRVVARTVTRLMHHSGVKVVRRAVIVGAGELGLRVMEVARQHPWAGLSIVGFVDDTRPASSTELPFLGRVTDIERILREHRIDDVVLALPQQSYDLLSQIVMDLQAWPVQIYIVPSFISLALYRASVSEIGGLPLINLRSPAMNPYQLLVKRILDLVLGTAIMVVTLPVMAGIALAIKLTSPGPAVFKQQRVGENGRLFSMYKFRTMVEDADSHLDEVIQRDNQGRLTYKAPDDPRVTRIGWTLRRTSLDELPQLVNVLKGEMSLVGPRPELPWLVEKYEPWQRKRFAVPQGMTGWWQINGRSNKQMHLSTEDDLYYIQNYSVLLDLFILWKTLGAVLRASGAF